MKPNWSNPLVGKSQKKKEESVLPLFPKEKLSLTKSEAKKILDYSEELGHHQIGWTQRWLEQRIRERSLPPQLSGANAFSSMRTFLSPPDMIALLEEIRAEFRKWLPPKEKVDYPLLQLESEESLAFFECSADA
jgi:hypothetical protein